MYPSFLKLIILYHYPLICFTLQDSFFKKSRERVVPSFYYCGTFLAGAFASASIRGLIFLEAVSLINKAPAPNMIQL